jgi:hypothetical protein
MRGAGGAAGGGRRVSTRWVVASCGPVVVGQSCGRGLASTQVRLVAEIKTVQEGVQSRSRPRANRGAVEVRARAAGPRVYRARWAVDSPTAAGAAHAGATLLGPPLCQRHCTMATMRLPLRRAMSTASVVSSAAGATSACARRRAASYARGGVAPPFVTAAAAMPGSVQATCAPLRRAQASGRSSNGLPCGGGAASGQS